jgi:hypothetical protein
MGRHDETADAIDAWFAAESVHLVLAPGRREEELAEIVDTAARFIASPRTDARLPNQIQGSRKRIVYPVRDDRVSGEPVACQRRLRQLLLGAIAAARSAGVAAG